jgi:hypothetical protein
MPVVVVETGKTREKKRAQGINPHALKNSLQGSS